MWLKNWAEVNGEEGRNPEVGKYIGVYFGFGVGSAALVVVQTLILWIFCSIEVSRSSMRLHDAADTEMRYRHLGSSMRGWPLPFSGLQ